VNEGIIMGNNDPEEENPVLPLMESRDLLDIIYVVNALLKNDGNVTRAAKELDIGRRTIYDLMEKYGISCTDGELRIKLQPILRYTELRSPHVERYLL
jgi:DNA-binding NtrC family response regulator